MRGRLTGARGLASAYFTQRFEGACAQTIVMPLGALGGVSRGDTVVAVHHAQQVRVGDALLGRVLDGMGRPIDGLGPVLGTVNRPLNPKPVDPLDRPLPKEVS